MFCLPRSTNLHLIFINIFFNIFGKNCCTGKHRYAHGINLALICGIYIFAKYTFPITMNLRRNEYHLNTILFVLDCVRLFQDHPKYIRGLKESHIVSLFEKEGFSSGDVEAQVKMALKELTSCGFVRYVSQGYRTIGPFAKLALARTPRQLHLAWERIECSGNQKGSGNSKETFESYDYGEEADASNGDISAPKSTIKPYFESNLTVYATKEIENITLECSPTNFNDTKHQILWYNGEHAITNGNISLSTDKYAIDNKYRLTILNYRKNTPGNFYCAVLPAEIRQYVIIEFGAPPENITDQNGAANFSFVKNGLILTTLMIIIFLSYGQF
ncbi:hypothetical protein DOY81_004462 [Sarcophaga bullata]|nr:hypothetical protein DOY81_004462 [Sarcophaga bullata]